MRRIFALVLICMFMLSHGSMGQAAPHADHHEAHGVSAVLDGTHETHPGSDEPASKAGHATHVHVVVALSESPPTNSVALVEPGDQIRLRMAAELASRAVPPLLEPPAA